jgi:Cu+-exporting ATPase
MVAKAKKKQNATAIHCDHCGAELPQSKVVENDKQFCCNGCSSVYAILKAGGLCEYYKISQTPGTINKTTVSFSDEELELLESHFVIGEGPDKTEILLHIPGMHCSSCIWLLEKLATLDNGIAGSRANFVQKQLRILYNKEKTSFGRIIKLLKSIGYEPSLMPEKERAAKSNSNRAILIKIGVAGFCAGNTMMFSFPQYLGLNTEAPNTFSTLFDSLNVLLSLPVVFYCGGEYLTAFYHWISKGLLSVKVPLAIGICSLWVRSLYEILSQT